MRADQFLDSLFGRGDDDYPYWLIAVRVDILVLVGCATMVLAYRLAAPRRGERSSADIYAMLVLTALATALRLLAAGNLMDFGGIGYSRMLVGYKGHFGAAQSYSLLYELIGRTIESAILFNRLAGILTIPLVYALCRRLGTGCAPFPAVAAGLFAVYPLHVLLSPSDALPTFSNFLTAGSVLLIAVAAAAGGPRWLRRVAYLGGFAGLALLTQVRYENALFLLPVALFLAIRRRSIAVTDLLPGLSFGLFLLAVYGIAATSARLSFQNPIRLESAVDMVLEHVVLNPFLTVPALFAATLLIAPLRSLVWGGLALLPWAVALALPIAAESGHGAARVFASWLILLLPLAGYGLALLLERGRVARMIAIVALAYFAVQPVIALDRLTARHLEIREHEFFRSALESLPAETEWLIVPDDELMRRETGSTIELYNKYSMTLAGVPGLAGRVGLVQLTDFLDHRQRTDCSGGRCAFFFGLPCLEQDVYEHTRAQCLDLAAEHDLVPLQDLEVVGAPFVRCSIYRGRMWEELCRPALRRHRMALYELR